MTFQPVRVWASNYGTSVELQEVRSDVDGSPELELTLDAGDAELTVRLDPANVRRLRLALARYEKEHPAQGPKRVTFGSNVTRSSV